MRLRLFALCVLSLAALSGGLAAGSSSAAVSSAASCSGDLCLVSTPFDGLRVDIIANAPPRFVRLWTAEANLSQALHPPSPCVPGSCIASQLVLIALDLQIRGLLLGCPGGCGFTATNAYVLDADVRGILSDVGLYPSNLQLYPPGPPVVPPGPPALPGPS